MTPIELYPSDASHKKSFFAGGFLLFLAFQFYTWGPNTDQLAAMGFAIAGVYVIGATFMRKANPKPSFAADQDGFSVMGKPKRRWDEFRGVAVESARIGIFPIAKRLRVKTGKNILGGAIPINITHLSAPAKDMAKEILAYAAEAQQRQAVGAAHVAPQPAPVQPAPVHTAPVRPAQAATPIAARLSETTAPSQGLRRAVPRRVVPAGSGPVKEVPTFGERLFGRRDVI